jgi:NhaA family Na+:H+ antiporter
MARDRGGQPRLAAWIEDVWRWVRGSRLAGAVLLITATVVAVVWANSPWAEAYQALLATPARVGYGPIELEKPLLLWINDGLMGIFFFVVGLEIKREVLAGELRGLRRASLPIAAAAGGMVVPAALFLLLNMQRPAADGWGIPVATDIAFAIGAVRLLGSRVPAALVVFLTALAIVDDIGAVVVIAAFYTEQVSLLALGLGAALLGLSVLLNVAGVRSAVAYFVVGTAVWLAFLESGVHATIAAVLMAWTIPARNRQGGEAFVARARVLVAELEAAGLPPRGRLLEHDQEEARRGLERAVLEAGAPLQRLEHALVPIATLVVIPVFALANAGVTLDGGLLGALAHPISLGVIAGLFLGKQLGIVGCAWLAVRTGLAELPEGASWRQVHAIATLAGIGFTMSLFISGLAYADPALREVAKLGVLGASLLAGAVGLPLLWRATRADSARDGTREGEGERRRAAPRELSRTSR